MSNSLGITLIETIVALSIFVSAGTAVLIGLSAAHTSSSSTNSSAVAEHLARNQMEDVWNQPYSSFNDFYTPIAGGLIPAGFGVTAQAVKGGGKVDHVGVSTA